MENLPEELLITIVGFCDDLSMYILSRSTKKFNSLGIKFPPKSETDKVIQSTRIR